MCASSLSCVVYVIILWYMIALKSQALGETAADDVLAGLTESLAQG